MHRSSLAASLLTSLLLSACTSAPGAQVQAAAHVDDVVEVRGLANIQRTLRRLASSTPARRERVRVLLYGQSITQSSWSRKLEQTLRAHFPHADLQIENRALGGFHAQLLVKAAESDLYAFYPDLVVFHVYGDHHRYEDIVRRIRERTTAEVLLQTDHVTLPSDLHEQTDAETLAPDGPSFSAFMNHRFLPGLVHTYDVALCDQRAAWKRHLEAHALTPDQLLSDDVHLNAHGDVLMARLVASCLRVEPGLHSPAERWVEAHALSADAQASGVLRLPFVGNRVDAILAPDGGGGGSVHARIDGAPPSAHASLYAFARAHAAGAGKWPPVLDLASEAPLLLETFHLAVERVQDEPPVFAFTLTGDRTGPDGEGRSDRGFVSRSRRVVIEPDDWTVDYAFMLAGSAPPKRFAIDVRVEPRFTDAFASVPGIERAITIAQGLPNTAHTLELTGDLSIVRAVRVHRPPLSPRAAGEASRDQ